jgi:hypothetical protein
MAGASGLRRLLPSSFLAKFPEEAQFRRRAATARIDPPRFRFILSQSIFRAIQSTSGAEKEDPLYEQVES